MSIGAVSAWRGEAASTVALAAPLILTQIAGIALTTTDVVLLGHAGTDTLAAGSLAISLYHAIMLAGVGTMSAVMAMVAKERGRMRHSVRDLRRTFRQIFHGAIALVIPFWIILWNGEAVLVALHQDPALSHEAGRLLRVLMWALLPFLIFIGLRSFVTAMERPMWTLVVSAAAIPVNAAIGWSLVFGHFGLPELGIVGVGWATFLTSIFMSAAFAVVIVTDRRLRRYRFFGRLWRPDWPRFATFFGLGIPIGLMVAFETTVFSAAAFLVGLIDSASLAAHTITLQIAGLAFMVPLGLSQAVTVRVGLAYGAGDRDALARAGWTGLLLTVVAMASTATVMTLWPEPLVGLFLSRTDPASSGTAAIAIGLLAIAALFQLADGVQAVGAGMLRGRHDTKVPMIIAGLGYWGIGLPASALLAFPAGLGAKGVWYGLAAGLGSVAVMLVWRWARLTGGKTGGKTGGQTAAPRPAT
jgi:MATE family multidrug resistance protein